MRVLDIIRNPNMRDKKIRGLKRKTKNMIKRIELQTMSFPSEFYNERYWHCHLPVQYSFISSKKTPYGIKRLCMQTLIDRAEHLIQIKPHTLDKTRVVVAIDLPELWDSQIIVFFDESYFEGFFDRNGEFQKWIPLTKERNIAKEWGLKIPKNMDIFGFKEELTDDDGNKYCGEIWFIGELK